MGEKKRIVVALGGNALGCSPEEQKERVRKAAEIIADLAAEGHEIVIGHGNGPQVGIINSAMDYASGSGPLTPCMPLAECCAMSQGYIGYHLQQALRQALVKRGLDTGAVSIVTQVVVDKDDPAFGDPSKPVGIFYTKEEADRIAAEKGFRFMEDAGRGYRRVVASPLPKRIVEIDAVRRLMESGCIVIAAGGGGVPVTEDADGLHGVSAVIDKDRSGARLAQEIEADRFIVLTAVDRVCINFNKPDQEELFDISVDEAEKYMEEGQFARGSMLPKVEACVQFIRERPQALAVITSLEKAPESLKGENGTFIHI